MCVWCVGWWGVFICVLLGKIDIDPSLREIQKFQKINSHLCRVSSRISVCKRVIALDIFQIAEQKYKTVIIISSTLL